MRCELTPEVAKADFEVVDVVDKPGGTVSTAASFRIDNGRPGLVPA